MIIAGCIGQNPDSVPAVSASDCGFSDILAADQGAPVVSAENDPAWICFGSAAFRCKPAVMRINTPERMWSVAVEGGTTSACSIKMAHSDDPSRYFACSINIDELAAGGPDPTDVPGSFGMGVYLFAATSSAFGESLGCTGPLVVS